MYSKKADYEMLREVSESMIPVDTLEFPKNLEYVGKGVVVSKTTNNEYYNNEHSFNQFVKLLDTRASAPMIQELGESLELDVINKLIKNKSREYGRILFRNKNVAKEKETISVQSDKYKVVNHVDLLSTIKNVVDKHNLTFEANLDWDNLNVRIPIMKVADHGQGVFFAIEMFNGQTGKFSTRVNSLLYELICTNGATMNFGNNLFVKQKHMGNINLKIDDLRDWSKNRIDYMKKLMPMIFNYKIQDVNKYINELFDASPIVSKQLAKEMLSYVSTFDKLAPTNQASLWTIIRTLTELSQRRDFNQRLQIDEFAGSLIKKHINMN